eukprot:s1570_g5.t1
MDTVDPSHQPSQEFVSLLKKSTHSEPGTSGGGGNGGGDGGVRRPSGGPSGSRPAAAGQYDASAEKFGSGVSWAMSHVFREILQEADFWHSDGCQVRPRSILVIDNLELIGGHLFSGEMLRPAGISSECVLNDFLRYRSDQVIDECKILWDAAKPSPLPCTRYVMKGIVTFPNDASCDFEVDCQTIPLPLLQNGDMPIRVVEMFAGACGGWKTALNFLHQHAGIESHTLALELDLNAAYAYAVGFGIPLVNGMSRVDPDLASKHKHLIVHTDITGEHWLEIASAWKPDLVVSSAPCQPWSSAGSASGMLSEMGQVLFKALVACKLLRPKVIALEQVSAFMVHEHFRFLVQILRWAGYNLHHSHVLDASDILPIARARWLAYALRVEDPVVQPTPFKGWIPTKCAVPGTWDVLLPSEWLNDPRLFPDSEVLALSARHDLLPPAKRRMVSQPQGLVNGLIPDGSVWTFDGFEICQLTDEHDLTTTIPATVPFSPFQIMNLCVSGQTFTFHVQHGIQAEHILEFWCNDFMFLPLDDDSHAVPTLVPRDGHDPCLGRSLDLAAILCDAGFFLVQRLPEVLTWFQSHFGGHLLDFQGTTVMHPALHDHPFTCGLGLAKVKEYRHSIAKYLLAVLQCSCRVDISPSLFKMMIDVTGTVAQTVTVIGFWQHLLDAMDLGKLGYSSRIQCTHVGTKLLLEPIDTTCPIPVNLLRFVMISRAFHVVLNKLNSPQGLPVKVKHFSKQVWFGRLPANMSFATLKQLSHAVSWVLHGDVPFRIVAKGRQPSDETCLEQVWDSATSHLTVHFVLSLHGGGSETGTKQGYRTQIKNAFASTLLDEGYDLSWTSNTVEQVMTKVGTRDLSQLLHQNPAGRLTFALDIIRKCDLTIPKIAPSRSSQTAASAKRKKQVVMPNPENYKAIEGVLLNESGSNANHLTQFGGHLNGYYMCTPQAALPWLRQGELLSKDELALVIFGDLPVDTQLKHAHVTLPCIDEKGRNVLVACVMVQCDEKQMKLQQGDGHNIAADGTILVAVTWWKHEWADSWNNICQNPYKCLRAFPGVEDILISVWGKSCRNGKLQTTANDATSVQVHCLLKEDAFAPFLKLSGFNSLWLTPKTKDGKPHPGWKMLWLDGSFDLQSATVQAAKLADSAGLVKQNGRYAIRVPKASFEDSWKVVYPQTAVPTDVDTSRIYKIESLPYGVTNKMLLEWAAHVNWTLKPLRAMGPKAWLVGCSSEPPAGPLHFNASPLLVREVRGKFQHTSHPIVAGPKPAQTSEKSMDFAKMSNAQLIGDPWASYSGPKPNPGPSTTVSGHANPANANPTMGPTEQKFAQQADRLTKLEAVVKTIQEGQTSQSEALEKMKHENADRDKAIRSHLDERLKSVQADLTQSFSTALNQQTANFESNMAEIKALLQKKPEKPKRKVRSQNEDGEDQDMSGS